MSYMSFARAAPRDLLDSNCEADWPQLLVHAVTLGSLRSIDSGISMLHRLEAVFQLRIPELGFEQ